MAKCKVTDSAARLNPAYLKWRDRGYDRGQHLWETPSGTYQIVTTVKRRPQSFVLYGPSGRLGSFGTLSQAQARAMDDRTRRQFATSIGQVNPINPNTRILLMGTALVGTAVAIAALLVAKKATASTSTSTVTGVALDTTDAGNTQNFVNVGQTITISIEASASQGYGYPAPVIASTPNGVLSAPTRATSATGISDTFTVLAAGSSTITYTETTPTGAAAPTVFTIIAS